MTRPEGPVRRLTCFALVAMLLVVGLPAAANRRDQKAADLFTEGVRLIRAGKYAEGAAKMRAALERASEPTDEQGSSTRFLARRYDPYYWLGVAQMEMGLDEQALQSFESSLETVPVGRSEALIKSWPDEHADLQRRMGILSKRLEPALVAEVRATPTARSPVSPTPTAVAVPTPAVPAAPVPVPLETPLAIRIGAARAVPTVAAAPPSPEEGGAALEALVARYRAWTADEVVGTVATELLGKRLASLESMRARRPSPGSVSTTVAAESRFFSTSVAPALEAAALRAALDAFGRQDWVLVDSHLARARAADPASARADLLECTALATRYVLEDRKGETLLASARGKLASWRAKVGHDRPLPAILSPGIRALLSASGTSGRPEGR